MLSNWNISAVYKHLYTVALQWNECCGWMSCCYLFYEMKKNQSGQDIIMLFEQIAILRTFFSYELWSILNISCYQINIPYSTRFKSPDTDIWWIIIIKNNVTSSTYMFSINLSFSFPSMNEYLWFNLILVL